MDTKLSRTTSVVSVTIFFFRVWMSTIIAPPPCLYCFLVLRLFLRVPWSVSYQHVSLVFLALCGRLKGLLPTMAMSSKFRFRRGINTLNVDCTPKSFRNSPFMFARLLSRAYTRFCSALLYTHVKVMASGMTTSTATRNRTCDGFYLDEAGLRTHPECDLVQDPNFGLLQASLCCCFSVAS